MTKFNLLLTILLLYTNEVKLNINHVSATIVQDTISKDISEVRTSDTLNHEFIIRKLNAIEDTYEVFHEETIASYYHDKFEGRKTANGETFSNNDMTAAHKTLPFGTKVRVTNIATGSFIIVEINDRGPFIRGREIDLSQKAFSKLSNKEKGLISVKVEILQNNIL